MSSECRDLYYSANIDAMNIDANPRMNIHQFVQMPIGVVYQVLVGPSFEDNACTKVEYLIELPEEMYAVRDNNSSFRRQNAIRPNDVV